MAHSGAVRDLAATVLRGQCPDAALRRRAYAAPIPIWKRVLGFEGCAPQLDRALRERSLMDEMPQALREMLRDSTSTALRLGLLAHVQLGAIASLARGAGIRVVALKGAAQLLAGQTPGTRSISDIDLLVMPADAARFHELLREKLRYQSSGPAYAHHLPVLERAGALGIDLHVQLVDVPGALDCAIWNETRVVMAGAHAIELPSPTNMVLHALEHGLRLNWMGRYRLRDVLDIATLYGPDVSDEAVRSYIARSPVRRACEILLSAAHELESRVPLFRRDAWNTIRRVARIRLALAQLPGDPRTAERVFRYAGLVAEGSPGSIVRAGRAAARRVAAACLHALSSG